MKKTYLVILLIATAIVSLVAGQLFREYVFDQDGVVSNISLSFTLDGSSFDPETEEWDWGSVQAGDIIAVPLIVTNDGGITVTLTYDNSSVPTGWIQAWDPDTYTIANGASATGDLTLYVPTDPSQAPDGMTINWSFTINATQV